MTLWRNCEEFALAAMPPAAAESVRTWQWSELLAAKEAACGISYGAFWADWPPLHPADTQTALWMAEEALKRRG